MIARPNKSEARTIKDVFGWSLPFAPAILPPDLFDSLRAAGMLATAGDYLRSRVRVSTLKERLFLHSAFPTDDADAVFFGPDSYRFADLIQTGLSGCRAAARIIDVGCGAGVGAIVAAAARPDATVLMSDINLEALRFARINALAAGVNVDAIEAAGLTGIDGLFDLVTLNPPYLVDAGKRTYRDGGGMRGAQLSLDLARAGMERLALGGKVILYTGSAIVDGGDALREALEREAGARGCTLQYREIDPDVFGEELEGAAYRDVDRIALVAAILTRA